VPAPGFLEYDDHQNRGDVPKMAITQPLIDTPADRPEFDDAVQRAADAVLAGQHPDGYWSYQLEADCTIPAEYVLMLHYLGEEQPELERKIGRYLRDRQAEHGGWPLYQGGDLDISCTVKAYYALKLIGDDTDAEHMQRAREAVLALIAAGHSGSEAARRGADYLIRTQATDGLWHDRWHTAPGFPRVFYLKYHGYTAYFPLWALARYRNLPG
jgi:squalene cyclase